MALDDPADLPIPPEVASIDFEPSMRGVMALLRCPDLTPSVRKPTDAQLAKSGKGARKEREGERHRNARLCPVAWICQHLHRSPRSVSRQFRELTGRRLAEFVHERVIVRAAAALRDTDAKVDTIAKAAGFSGGSAFARSYAQATGMLPDDYRPWARRRKRIGPDPLAPGATHAGGRPGS